MTEEQKRLERALLEEVEGSTGLADMDGLAAVSLALIELWKICDGKNETT